MINNEKTLKNSNDFVSSFSEAKYFILITDDVTQHVINMMLSQYLVSLNYSLCADQIYISL